MSTTSFSPEYIEKLRRENQMLKAAATDAIKAMEQSHYEFTCLEPRLSGNFQRNAGACRKNLSLAISLLKQAQS